MKAKDFIKRTALPALAAVLVLGAATGNSASYFTTYVTAQGGHVLQLHDVYVRPHESVDANVKSVTAENTGESECYVRVMTVQATTVPVAYEGAGWTDGGDGYWYYATPIQPGESTGVLKATITLPTDTPDKPIEPGAELNVVVITECAKVLYDDNGAAKPNGPGYEGWALKAKEG